MTFYVIDDHPLMSDAIGLLLRRLAPDEPLIKLSRLSPLSSAVRAHGQARMISLDLKLPDTSGVSGVRQVREMFPAVPLAVISASQASDMEGPCLDAGADLYIEKCTPGHHVQSALAGLLAIDEDAAEAWSSGQTLSKRQKQLIVMLEEGLSNRDIADKLAISEHTVKVHLWRLFRRLQVKSRSQAVHLARRQGLLPG
ncbi:MAG: response regulator transcription factor [Comamonas sp.]